MPVYIDIKIPTQTYILTVADFHLVFNTYVKVRHMSIFSG